MTIPSAMKYGAHCYLFTERWSDAQVDLLEKAKAWELDFLEIAVGDDVSFDPALTRQRAEALALTLTVSPGGEWPLNCDLSADDPADRARGLAWHKRQIETSAELGAVAYTGAIYGHPGVVKRRIPPPDEYKRTAEGLHALADYAAQHNVTLVLEPMSHFRTHLVNTPLQVMHLIELAGHDQVRALLDTYHLVTEIRDYAEAIDTVKSRLWGIHACENDRGAPGGGMVPWTTIFKALHAAHFSGYVMLETYNSAIGHPQGTFAYQRGMFHNPCPDGGTFVRQSLAFLKRGLA